MIFGTYRCDAGSILVHQGGDAIDVATAEPRQILALRRTALGYVSQFLRAVPRVAAIDVVAEPLVIAGVARAEARQKAAELLRRLNIPERLWALPPATFSGGEQQRVNIARGFLPDLPILLAGRADRFARRRQPRRGGRSDRRKKSGAAPPSSRSSTTTTSATAIADTIIDVTRFASAAVKRS